MSGSELRRLPRVEHRARVALGKTALFTLDLSPGGFCAELLHPLAPGTPVAGSLALGMRDFPFTGQVVWAREGDARRTRRGRIGVRFTGIENRFFDVFRIAFPKLEAPATDEAQGAARRAPATP